MNNDRGKSTLADDRITRSRLPLVRDVPQHVSATGLITTPNCVSDVSISGIIYHLSIFTVGERKLTDGHRASQSGSIITTNAVTGARSKTLDPCQRKVTGDSEASPLHCQIRQPA